MTETISIPVSPSLARQFNRASPEVLAGLETVVENYLADYRRKKLAEASRMMDESGALAKANGLTPEILEELLRDD